MEPETTLKTGRYRKATRLGNSKLNTMKNIALLIILMTSILFTNCSQDKLNNSDAEKLIRATLKLPKSFNNSVGEGIGQLTNAEIRLNALQDDGLITYTKEWDDNSGYILSVTPTEKGKPYFIGLGSSTLYKNRQGFLFKTHDIDLDQITGISINKESQTATVRFTVKAINVTPVANSLNRVQYFEYYSLDSPINGELVFKKFDNGWQLESSQNKSASELLDDILGVKMFD